MSYRRVTSIREIAERLARALREAGVFVFDRDLVDQASVSHLVGIAGIDQFLVKQTHGDKLVIYALRTDIVEGRCRSMDCRETPPEEARACISECFYRRLAELLDTIERSLADAASSVEEEGAAHG